MLVLVQKLLLPFLIFRRKEKTEWGDRHCRAMLAGPGERLCTPLGCLPVGSKLDDPVQQAHMMFLIAGLAAASCSVLDSTGG
jgi:hypothetical protein